MMKKVAKKGRICEINKYILHIYGASRRCRFFRVFLYHYRFLLVGDHVVRFSLLDSVFLPCDHGLDF